MEKTKIELRYYIGQQVWFMKDNKATCTSIYGIKHFSRTYVGGGRYQDDIIYDMNSIGNFNEKDVYESKEALLASL